MKKYKMIEDKKGFGNLVPIILAVVISFCLLFVGNYVNGTIHEELLDNAEGTNAEFTMNNTSKNWDSAIDIIQIVIIITLLAAAIGAIFLFTRFRA